MKAYEHLVSVSRQLDNAHERVSHNNPKKGSALKEFVDVAQGALKKPEKSRKDEGDGFRGL
jgi:hypothetical protein